MSGILLVLSGPSGVGKGTLADALCKHDENVRISVSATTRGMRPGETEGVSYFFVDTPTFDDMCKNHAFLECATVHGNRYGTPRAAVQANLEAGNHVVLDIDVKGAAQIRESCPEAVHVFVLPPSLDILEARLRGRGTETCEQIELRMRNARAELEQMHTYDYAVVNDDIEQAVHDLLAILRAEMCKTARVDTAPYIR